MRPAGFEPATNGRRPPRASCSSLRRCSRSFRCKARSMRK